MNKQHIIFDTEIIGSEKPVFLICCKIVETGETFAFWHDKRGHTAKLSNMLQDSRYTWVGFNSENFDRPLVAMAVEGHDEANIKIVAENIIAHNMRSWQTYREYDIDFLEYDHIDIMEVPKGVMLSLKIYEGRMHSPTLQDMPFDHTHDVTPKERKLVEAYCMNDVNETERLFLLMQNEVLLREQLGAEYGVDLRSKSDAQCAEAILKKVCSIGNKDKIVPGHVRYICPSFIKTDSKLINEIIELCEEHKFKINYANGSPEFPEFLTEPIKIGAGIYQMGIGGLHSQHDLKLFLEATDRRWISDFDVASYYPNIMMKAGLIPNLGGNKGELFLSAYQDIYEDRIAAKRAGEKAKAETLKIVLNGTFGKLGSIFCSFYAPELMLAVTITGQLNLLCLIHELNKIKGVKIESANTDGIMVSYDKTVRHKVLGKVQVNAKRTRFDYEETPYRNVAMKDVNNYLAVPDTRQAVMIENGKIVKYKHKLGVKRKGLYAEAGVHENKNPTMQVCSDAVAAYLSEGYEIEDWVNAETDIRKFLEIRNVSGGGVQHTHEVEVDDWVCVNDLNSAKSEWRRPSWPEDKASVKRKSRPAPVWEGRGGKPFGRVARWYMTTQSLPPLTYVKSGNKVPTTDGGKLCLVLPDRLPDDLNKSWYINEAHRILNDLGVTV